MRRNLINVFVYQHYHLTSTRVFYWTATSRTTHEFLYCKYDIRTARTLATVTTFLYLLFQVFDIVFFTFFLVIKIPMIRIPITIYIRTITRTIVRIMLILIHSYSSDNFQNILPIFYIKWNRGYTNSQYILQFFYTPTFSNMVLKQSF